MTLAQQDEQHTFVYRLLYAYAPILLVNLTLAILPFGLKAVAVFFERLKLWSQVQETVLGRYFMFEMANIFLTLFAGTIYSVASSLYTSPASTLRFVAQNMPQCAIYFLELILFKLLLVLPFEVSRAWPLLRTYVVRRNFRNHLTDRDLRMGAFEKPEFRYGFQYPSKIMVIVVASTYAGIAPVLYFAALIYFAAAYVVYARQMLYVYIPYYEAGGVFFVQVFNRLFCGMTAGCVTFTFFLLISSAYWEAVFACATVPVLLATYYCLTVAFDLTSARLSLETAVANDEHARSLSDKPPADAFDAEYFRQPCLKSAFKPMLPNTEPTSPWGRRGELIGGTSRSTSSWIFKRARSNTGPSEHQIATQPGDGEP